MDITDEEGSGSPMDISSGDVCFLWWPMNVLTAVLNFPMQEAELPQFPVCQLEWWSNLLRLILYSPFAGQHYLPQLRDSTAL